MKFLGIETSSPIGSVAVQVGELVLERSIATPREQTAQLLALVDELLGVGGLTLRELDAIAYGRGPGSFTGLRVSVAVAQGLAAVAKVPLVPVSSLVCLATRAWREHGSAEMLVCIDAHMGEVYSAEFTVRGGRVDAVGNERLCRPEQVTAPDAAGFMGVGNGFTSHSAALADISARATGLLPGLVPVARDLFPTAAVELAAGRVVPAHAALPVYLREHTAWRRQS